MIIIPAPDDAKNDFKKPPTPLLVSKSIGVEPVKAWTTKYMESTRM
jgi:hypothetical protein